MDHHVRVLQARVEAGAVGGSNLSRERAGHEDEKQREEARNRAQHRHRPRQHLGGQATVEGDRGRPDRRQHEEPEQQRAFLAAPERRVDIGERQRLARVLGDVGEREVTGPEGVQQDDRRDGCGAERSEEGISRRGDEPPPARVGA